jgi:hypothetical protein
MYDVDKLRNAIYYNQRRIAATNLTIAWASVRTRSEINLVTSQDNEDTIYNVYCRFLNRLEQEDR